MANDGTLKIGVEIDEQGFKSGLSKLGGVAKTALVGVTAAAGAASAAVGALAKSALDAYGDYEQLIGGVETLFKESAGVVENYANNAYKTAGLSANQYMETVRGFSASLLQSLGGDTARAADIADQAIIDMADNANKMGTDMESIQYAYQGFAKQNYTMLDNLKLGYGGTKEEMERLLADAEKISGIHFDISSFSDVVQAIHVIQDDLGITGTTAEEAASTIQGSLASMGAAWQNLVTGIADENADLDTLIDNFVDSLITAADNILPRLEQILIGFGELIVKMAPIIAEQLPAMVASVLPSLLEAGAQLIEGLIAGITSALPAIAEAAAPILLSLVEAIAAQLPALAEAAVQIIVTLAEALSEALPDLIPAIVEAIVMIAEVLTDPDNISAIVDAGLTIMLALVQGLIAALPQLIEALPQITENIIAALVANAPKLLEAGATLLTMLVDGLLEAIPYLLEAIPGLIEAVINGILSGLSAIKEAGGQLFENFTQGFLDKVAAFIEKVKSMVNTVVDTVKGLFSGGSGGGTGRGGGSTSGGASRARVASTMTASGGEGNAEAASQTASPAAAYNRAAAVRALESAMPAAQARMDTSTAAMTPAAGYSALPVAGGPYGGGNGQQTPVILRPNWTMQFQGDLAQVGRVMNPVIKSEDIRIGSGV